mmetsp:Transcript_42227/g.90089  ORF Transcript_42227/g.90089 Transcript_42227/m.90089 type:complete len:316 (-) Transcript_42227:718-1665(-)
MLETPAWSVRGEKRTSSDDSSSTSASDTEEVVLSRSPKRQCSSGGADAAEHARAWGEWKVDELTPEYKDELEHAFQIGHELPDSVVSALEALEPATIVPDESLQVEELLWQLVAPSDTEVDEEEDEKTPPSSPAYIPASLPSRRAAASAPHNRKEWAAEEDDAIRLGVAELGMRWRAIAARLPGRSDDAVRNRWARLQSSSGPTTFVGAHSPTKRPTGVTRQKREGVEARHSWTAEEDAIITASVNEWGRRWNRIVERLPKRTEHAIRNRWHRLQMAALDEQDKCPTIDRETGHVDNVLSNVDNVAVGDFCTMLA